MARNTQKDTDKTPEETPEDQAPVNTSGQPQEDGATVNQEGAPEALVEATKEAEDQGFIGSGVPEKADYSQANSAVMNGGS